MRCIYLGMDSLEGYVSDADLSIPAMQDMGWQVQKQSWRDSDADWGAADLVYICTPWDYHEHVEDFLDALERISASGTMLINPLETVRWNAVKTYLGDLEKRGIRIVPTRWHEELSEDALDDAFAAFGTTRLVIKPTVGASALDTHVLTRDSLPLRSELLLAYAERPYMLQPFMETVQTIGEYSLFYFDGAYSHAILKVPKVGDFRTQEEHGSDIRPFDAPAELIAQGRAVVDAVSPQPAYARVDYVDDGEMLLMELELIEPSLYFRTDPGSPRRFAEAITNFYRRESGR